MDTTGLLRKNGVLFTKCQYDILVYAESLY